MCVLGMQDTKVTIIIPHYNEPVEWLSRAIESALRQKGITKEVIVIDDHSVEDPRAQIQSYNITYIRHASNQRLSAARNTAIAAAQGEWIISLDSDDYFSDDYVLEKLLKHEEDADVLYGNLITENDRRLTPNKQIHDEDWEGNNQIYATSMFRKSLWEQVGGFWVRDEAFPEDWDFWWRAWNTGARFYYVPVDVYYHTYRKDSEWERMKSRFPYFKELITKHVL